MSFETRLFSSSLSVPDRIQFAHVIVFLLIASYGLAYYIFSLISGFSYDTYIPVAVFLAAFFVAYQVILGIKKLTTRVYLANETDRLKQCKTDLFIGLAGGLIVAWIPRIYVFFEKDDMMILYFNAYIGLFTATTFWLIFVADAKKTCKVVYTKTEKLPWIIAIVNVVIMCISVCYGLNTWWAEYFTRFISTQILFFTICTVCMIELCQVWQGKVEMIEKAVCGVYENPLMMENGQAALFGAQKAAESNMTSENANKKLLPG